MTITIKDRTPYTVYCEVAAWAEDYTLLPGTYPVEDRCYHPGHPFKIAKVEAEVVYAKKAALFGGFAMTKATGPEKGTKTVIEVVIANGPYIPGLKIELDPETSSPGEKLLDTLFARPNLPRLGGL